MQYERVQITNTEGEKLSGRLELPTGRPPRAYALFAHCFTCGMNLNSAVSIARAMTQAGIAVLRFDFTGLGGSEGEFADTSFSTDVRDLITASEFLGRRYKAPKILIGHSLGGTACLAAAESIPSVVAVATVGSPAHPAHVQHLLDTEKIEREGVAEVCIAGRPFVVKQEFLDDLKSVPMDERIGELKRALLVLHAPKDELVSVDQAREIFIAAKHPKSFVALDGADHLLTKKSSAEYAGQVIASWANQYLPEEEVVPTNKLTVENGEKGFLSTVQVGTHRMLADEPKSFGGTDLGPTPYDLLSAALGTCTAMTLRMYADRKGWPLKKVKVEVDHSKEHIQDCEGCEESDRKIDHFERVIEVMGDLDDQQRKRLMQIADRCPVHKTLEVASRITTSQARPLT